MDFKERIINLLEYLISSTKETANSDNLEGFDLELTNAYCDGLETAIYKIKELEE